MLIAADLPPRTTAELDPPAIVTPGPRQTTFGRVTVRLAPGTERITVLVNGVEEREQAVSSPVVRFRLALPKGPARIRVIAHDGDGNSSWDAVEPVVGLPRAARPTGTVPQLDPVLQRRIRKLTNAFPGITGFYVMNLRTGVGAGWNARARFPAASTVKLGIAIAVLRRLSEPPRPGTWLERQLRRMLVISGNKATNELLEWLGGTQSGGAAKVSALLRRVGLVDTYLYSGYILGTASTDAKPIPLNVVARPSFAGKYTSAWDLARLHRYLHSATVGRGPLAKQLRGFKPAEARTILYYLTQSADRGKLDRYVADAAIAVPHKAGWIRSARHDAGIVYWPGGAFVATVMTWNANGVNMRADVLAGRVAETALERYEALAQKARTRASARSAWS